MERSGERAVARTHTADLRRRLAERRAAARRHGTWALLGLSPAALIPLVLWGNEYGVIGAVAASALVTITETWRAFKAGRDADRIEVRLAGVEDEVDE